MAALPAAAAAVPPAPPAPLLDANGVTHVLTVCGATPPQRAALVGEGFATMEDFLIMEVKDITDMANNVTRLSAARGGARIGAVLTKRLKGLIFWCHDRHRRGHNLDANAFTAEALRDSLQRLALSKQDDETTPTLPTEFNTNRCRFGTRKNRNVAKM